MPVKALNTAALFIQPAGTVYVNSVQYGSIVIAGGAVSGSAIINAVTSGTSFVVFLGFTCSTTTNQSNIIAPRVVLTNTTTVTAARNSTDTGTVTVYFAVVDGTGNLIQSVEQNTAAFSAASTKTITLVTSVDTTRTAVFWLGNTSSDTSATAARRTNCRLISGTQVTCTSNSSHTGTTGFVVVQFQAAAIQSLQLFTTAYTSANATDTQAVTAVTMANSMIADGGINNGGASYYTKQLTSTTNVNLVRIQTSVASRTPDYVLIEFVPGVVKSLQRGTISLQSATSNTATITSVSTTKTLLNFTGYNNTSTDTVDKLFQGETLTNATTVTGFINTSSATAKQIGYEAVEFN